MTTHQTRGFAVLAVAVGLAIVVAIGGGSRLSPSGSGAGFPLGAANDPTARLRSDEPALRARLLAVTNRQPLLAALQNHLDGPALLGLLQSADWWRDVRSEFQMARVVLGTEAWATLGALDPGMLDRDVVATARRLGFASGIAAIHGRSCALLAARLPVLPDKAPVLVLAKVLDDPRSRPGSRPPIDFVLWAIALLMAGGAARLLAPRRLTTDGPNAAPPEAIELDSRDERGARPQSTIAARRAVGLSSAGAWKTPDSAGWHSDNGGRLAGTEIRTLSTVEPRRRRRHGGGLHRSGQWR